MPRVPPVTNATRAISVSSLAVFYNRITPVLALTTPRNKNARRKAGHLFYQFAPWLTDDLFIT
jgi:hypothetical protein